MKPSISNRRVGARAAAVVAASAALALGGGVAACGGGSDADDAAVDRRGNAETEIRAAYDGYVKSLYDKDPEGACAAMTRNAQEEMGAGRPCAKRMTQTLDFLPLREPRPRIAGLAADGEGFKAKVMTGSSKTATLWFAREGGDWKIDAGLYGRPPAGQPAAGR